ncbi:hypothetical protein [Agrobacterium deltaense]|uniref:hypothetical protein n=1 Tax=Agrobacterium deltaense TaxID=1183412 RepID=UPI001CB78470|nr:hypothetical protein [Agrobacterium deltaense]
MAPTRIKRYKCDLDTPMYFAAVATDIAAGKLSIRISTSEHAAEDIAAPVNVKHKNHFKINVLHM